MRAGIGLAYHNLSTMLGAGVPLQRSLNTVRSGLGGRLGPAFEKLAEAVSKGNTLTETMVVQPKVFGPLDVMIVGAAEESGSLPELLGLLSKWHEHRQRIRKRIISGLTLPVVLIHLTAIFAPLPAFFLSGGHILPLVAEIVGILLLFYVPAAAVIAIIRLTPKDGPLRETLDRLVLRIPVLGPAVYKLSISRYCWVFHMLLKAGLPITACAEKAADATGNAVVAEQVRGGAASAARGQPVSEGFGTKLPIDFLDLWRVGEETGELDTATGRLAAGKGEDAEFLLTEFGRWLPRVIYFLVCLLIVYYIFRNLRIVYGRGF
ncbi:MAG: type II secretion system F family protein [Planctomycetota bacterium]